MHWDLYVTEDELEDTAAMAKKLGWKGLGVLTRKKAKHQADIDISSGVIFSGKASTAVKNAKSSRRSLELVAVEGGELETNRAACETAEVDLLLRPWKNRNDCGMDLVMAKLAAKNNVSVVFDFHSLVNASRRSRAMLMSNMLEAAKLVRKAKAPFVIASGAVEAYDLRSPSDLLSFGRTLGFRDPDIKKAISGSIVMENRKRLSGKWIMPGVEKV